MVKHFLPEPLVFICRNAAVTAQTTSTHGIAVNFYGFVVRPAIGGVLTISPVFCYAQYGPQVGDNGRSRDRRVRRPLW